MCYFNGNSGPSLSQVIGPKCNVWESASIRERERLFRGAAQFKTLTGKERKKSIAKEEERLILAPTRAKNRPEFNAAPVKDRTGYEKALDSHYSTGKAFPSSYTHNPEVTAAGSGSFFGGRQKSSLGNVGSEQQKYKLKEDGNVDGWMLLVMPVVKHLKCKHACWAPPCELSRSWIHMCSHLLHACKRTHPSRWELPG